MKVLIIGAGIAGLTTAYILKEKGIDSLIVEKEAQPGGLSRSFELCGEWFDMGGHASFAKEQFVREILEQEVDCFKQKAVAYNYKKGKWIKNPAQINLSALDTEEKIAILDDYFRRPRVDNPKNYMEWLECQYGKYFAHNYPTLYTEKYWTVNPEQLETNWVGNRMYQPTPREVLYGAFEKETKEVHYSGEIRYPKKGGFEAFIKALERSASIRYGSKIAEIDVDSKMVLLDVGEKLEYDYLVNTAPLPEIVPLINNVSNGVVEASKKLNATSLILVSVCLDGKLKVDLSPSYYIYDSDIPATRVYSPTKYSGEYGGKTALQAEVYVSRFRSLSGSLEEIRDKVISQLAEIGLYDLTKVIAKDVRFEKYANIMFTHDIYENRNIVSGYLKSNGIVLAGRFGEWKYYWTDQAMLSGKRAAEQIIQMM
ncbi:Protoporphyrinogen oxidase [Lachnospiraceae bacterium KHCPX20]|nr:Protoporphyrinogen oxidase [Lachnospiraceae bacterium KHCPX20]